MKYKVIRGIENKQGKRYEAGEVVDGVKLKGWPVKAWLISGVLESVPEKKKAVKDGDS